MFRQRDKDRCISVGLNLPKGGTCSEETGIYSHFHRLHFQTRVEICLWFVVFVLIIYWLLNPYWQENEIFVDDILLPSEMKWGDQGRGVTIFPRNLSWPHKQEIIEGLRNHGYNTFVGDRISLRRPLPQLQSSLCRHLWSNVSLQASVVIVYHDEVWSTLMRTIFSVLDRSEPHLLKDIIVVDNGSLNPKVKGLIVERYLTLFPKVKVIHLPQRHSLWQARAIGAQEALGNVSVFLHSRCECSHGWLSPLLGRLEENSQVIAVPTVDTIDPFTFEYEMVMSVHDIQVGSFSWDLEKTVKQPQYFYGDEEVPIPTPVIKDGIIAVTKTFFSAVGDALLLREEETENCTLTNEDCDNADVEDISLSFRAWMCGGSIEIIPCSHVGLVSPHWLPGTRHVNYGARNRRKLVLAEILMDEFKQHVYDRIEGCRPAENENILKRYQSLRNQTTCHSFSWFLANVAKPLTIPPLATRRGELIHNISNSDKPLILGRQGFHLQLDDQHTTPVVLWYLTAKSFLVTDDYMCLAVSPRSSRVLLRPCDVKDTVFLTDIWNLTETGQLYYNRTQLCLGIDNSRVKRSIRMVRCNHTMATGKWFFSL